MPDDRSGLYFAFFTEIGIIAQLSRALLEAGLPGDMTVQHFSVLNHLLKAKDGRTPLEIATAFQVPKTSLSHTLAGLERRGFIEMRPNPKDGRSKLVWMTEAGEAFRNSAIAEVAPRFGTLADQITPDMIEALLPKLAEIREIMDKARD